MVNVFSRLVQMYDLYPLFLFFFCNLWYYMKLFSNFADVHPKSPYGDSTKCASDTLFAFRGTQFICMFHMLLGV